MKVIGTFSRQTLVLGAIALVIAGAVQADLVLDEEASVERVEDRDNLRKVVKASQKVETANELNAATTVTTVTTAPVVVEQAPAPIVEAPSMTKSELVRRSRMREEMKNEDLLQQRLEELRLRDEQRRSKKLLKSAGLEEEEETAPKASAESAGTAAPVMKEEQIVAPITERPGQSAQMTPAPQVQQTQVQPIQSDNVAITQSSYNMSAAPVTAVSTPSKTNGVSIMPKLGYTTINNDNYDFNSKFTVGLALGFSVSDYVGLELGYAYSEFGLRPGNRYYVPGYYGANFYEEMEYKQNTFDLGMKLFFVNAEAKVRPYVGGGAAYSMGFINYNKRTRDMIAMYPQYNKNVTDYELNQIMGFLSAGLDFKVSSNVTIGAAYKYFAPLSSTENETLYNSGFYGAGIPGNAYDPQKDYVRGSIKDSSSHLFQVGANFYF